MTIERIVELEKFIEREMKGNEALTKNAGCVARAKIDRDILACLKELKAHRRAWKKLKNDIVAYHNNYDYDTAMNFLNTVVGLCTDIYDDTDAGGDAE